MASLTSYGYGQHLLFVLFACLLLIAACVMLFREATHLGGRRMSRILPECAALLLILSVTLLFSGSWGLMLGGLMPGGRLRLEKLASLIEVGKLNVKHLITHRFEGFEKVEDALMLMKDKPADLIKPVVSIGK